MKFSSDKRQAIIVYILEKISRGDEDISQATADAFEINRNTAHSYINDLVNEGVIDRVKRGQYTLIKKTYKHTLKRSKGDLDEETYIYRKYILPLIEHFESNVTDIWAYTFSEMFNNVIDHSEAETVDIIVEQDYLNTRVLINDSGIGIFKKIKDYFWLKTLEDAISELFKGKLTTDAENHSGEGIFFSSKMMDDFYILSDGKVFTNNKYDDSTVDSVSGVGKKGTCVVMTLSNFSKKTSREIFDEYSTVENGFSSTRIPLKNMFDESPVSRSQAKRVCNRLEKFKEVILDFEGVEWMGQGFADQIFRVFAKAHSDIQLTPINMNEDVTKMYFHIINTQ